LQNPKEIDFEVFINDAAGSRKRVKNKSETCVLQCRGTLLVVNAYVLPFTSLSLVDLGVW
jgi:hypothetical protein